MKIATEIASLLGIAQTRNAVHIRAKLENEKRKHSSFETLKMVYTFFGNFETRK